MEITEALPTSTVEEDTPLQEQPEVLSTLRLLADLCFEHYRIHGRSDYSEASHDVEGAEEEPDGAN